MTKIHSFKPPRLQFTRDEIDWFNSDQAVEYEHAQTWMEERVEQIIAGNAKEAIWCLTHPALYTLGTSGHESDLLDVQFPVYKTGRGGKVTYHGPGQQIVYVMLHLTRRQMNVHQYVHWLEEWIIAFLDALNIQAFKRSERVGVWVANKPNPNEALNQREEDKIAAIGVRIRKWVTWHGFAININPDLSHYTSIVPCGIDQREYGVTSLANQGCVISSKKTKKLLENSMPNCDIKPDYNI